MNSPSPVRNAAYDVVERVGLLNGFDRICPESLTMMLETPARMLAVGSGYTEEQVSSSLRAVMRDIRAMFAPA